MLAFYMSEYGIYDELWFVFVVFCAPFAAMYFPVGGKYFSVIGKYFSLSSLLVDGNWKLCLFNT